MNRRLNASAVVLAAAAGLLVAALFFGGGTRRRRLPAGRAGGALRRGRARRRGARRAPAAAGAGRGGAGVLRLSWAASSCGAASRSGGRSRPTCPGTCSTASWPTSDSPSSALCVGAVASRRTVATGLAVALGAVIAWALAGKVFPRSSRDGEEVSRLRSPVGYWNALALLCAAAAVLGLWLATDRARGRGRPRRRRRSRLRRARRRRPDVLAQRDR